MTQSAIAPRLGGPDAMIPEKEAVPGSQRGSHPGGRLHASGARIRTGGWRSCQPAGRSGRRRTRYRYLRIW